MTPPTRCQRLDTAADQLRDLERVLAATGPTDPVPAITFMAARQVCHNAHETLREHGWRVPLRSSVAGLASVVAAARRYHDDDGSQWS